MTVAEYAEEMDYRDLPFQIHMRGRWVGVDPSKDNSKILEEFGACKITYFTEERGIEVAYIDDSYVR